MIKYIMIDVETLKELYKANRKLRDQNARYLRMLDRYRAKEADDIIYPYEEDLGTDRFKGLFNFNF
jgi:hypothetical protein